MEKVRIRNTVKNIWTGFSYRTHYRYGTGLKKCSLVVTYRVCYKGGSYPIFVDWVPVPIEQINEILAEGKTETAREDFLRKTEYSDNLKQKNYFI